MREEWTRGTTAASLIRPIRRPFMSKTGIETSSVKYRSCSAIVNAQRRTHGAHEGTDFEFGPELRSTQVYRRHSQYGASRRKAATKNMPALGEFGQSPRVSRFARTLRHFVEGEPERLTHLAVFPKAGVLGDRQSDGTGDCHEAGNDFE